MRWQCKECNELWGNVIFMDKIQILKFAYCPNCDKMTWQKTLPETGEISENNDKQSKKPSD